MEISLWDGEKARTILRTEKDANELSLKHIHDLKLLLALSSSYSVVPCAFVSLQKTLPVKCFEC